MNQAIHTVDLLLWLLGDVARVHARTSTLLHDIEVEDSGAAILEFASGALGVLSFTTAAYPGYPRRVSVTGGAGSIVLEQDAVVAWDLKEPGGFPPRPRGASAGAPIPDPCRPSAASVAARLGRWRRTARSSRISSRRSARVVRRGATGATRAAASPSSKPSTGRRGQGAARTLRRRPPWSTVDGRRLRVLSRSRSRSRLCDRSSPSDLDLNGRQR